MPAFKDLTGERFGMLTVLRHQGKACSLGGTPQHLWLCRCACGSEKVIRGASLRSGKSSSCGCKRHMRLGHSRHPLYPTFTGIIQRCYNPKSVDYPNYGGRGIEVYREWRDCPERFIDYVRAMGWDEGDSRSIDRIDNNGHYEPGNIRLADRFEQGRNKRSNVVIEFRGRSLTMAEWAEQMNIPYGRLQTRIFRGWPPERALTEPAHR